MSTHSIHGYSFTIERDGFSTAHAAGEQAEWNLVDLLKAQPAEVIAKLHADLLAYAHPDSEATEEPDLAFNLCCDAVKPLTADWHRPEAASLMLSAA